MRFLRARKPQQCPGQRRRANRKRILESLEARCLLAAEPIGSSFAEFIGTLDPAVNEGNKSLDVVVTSSELSISRESALLGFVVQSGSDSTWQPDPAVFQRADGGIVAPTFSRHDQIGSSLVLVDLTDGQYQIDVSGQGIDASAEFSLSSFLVGDVDGDADTDSDDLEILQAAYGSVVTDALRAGDANGDGRITVFDLNMARRNERRSASHTAAGFVPIVEDENGQSGIINAVVPPGEVGTTHASRFIESEDGSWRRIVPEDDTLPSISIEGITIREGERKGEDRTWATLAVSLTEPTDEAVQVTYRTLDRTAIAGQDFAAAENGVLVIPAGHRSAAISVFINEDTLDETTELFDVVLDSATAGGEVIEITKSHATVTLRDQNPIPTVEITGSLDLSNRNATNFTIELSRPSEKTVSVDFYGIVGFDDGRPEATQHFETIVFLPEQTRKVVQVSWPSGLPLEAGQSISGRLNRAINATLDGVQAEGYVNEDDSSLQISVPDITVDPRSETATLLFELIGQTDQPLSVGYHTLNGTAKAGEDYLPLVGEVSFLPGQQFAEVEIPIIEDAWDLDDETFDVRVVSSTNEDWLIAQATVTILSNDSTVIDEDQLLSEFVGILNSSSEVDRLDITVSRTDGQNEKKSRLAFHLADRQGDGQLNPRLLQVISQTGQAVDFTYFASDWRGSESSLLVADVLPGNYQLVVTADTNVRRQYELSVYQLDDGIEVRSGIPAKSEGEPISASVNEQQPKSRTSFEGLGHKTVVAPQSGYDEDLPMRFFESSSNSMVQDGGGSGGLVWEGGFRYDFVWDVREASYTNQLYIHRLESPADASSGASGSGSILVFSGTEVPNNSTSAGYTHSINVPHSWPYFSVYMVSPDGTWYPYSSLNSDSYAHFNGLSVEDLVTSKHVGNEPDHDDMVFSVGLVPPPTISIGDVTVNENAGTASFPVTLSHAYDGPVAASYSLVEGTAKANGDYGGGGGSVNFSPGQTSTTISIPITNDQIAEHTEDFYVSLYDLKGAYEGDMQGVGTIFDDDPLMLEVDDASASESNGTAYFDVTLNREAAFPVVVQYETSNGTAAIYEDYTETIGTITIAAGDTYERINVPLRDDEYAELTEHFYLWLNTSTTDVAPTSLTATGTIFDDDLLYLNADFSAENVFEGENVTLSGTYSGIAPGEIATIEIDWYNNDSVDHTLSVSNGTFSVTRLIPDDHPATGTASDLFFAGVRLENQIGMEVTTSAYTTLQNVEPEIQTITPSHPKRVAVGETYSITGQIFDPAMHVATESITATIYWGDDDSVEVSVDSSGYFYASHVYSTIDPDAAVEAFWILVEVEDDDLGSNSHHETRISVYEDVDLDTDSNNDGTIDPDNSTAGKDDPIEEDSPGRIVLLNDDDDDGNGTPDLDDNSTAVGGEDDLAEVNLGQLAGANVSASDNWTVTLTSTGGIQIWDSTTKDNLIELTDENIVLNSLTQLYVEGTSLGPASLKVELKQDGTTVITDLIQFTVGARLDIDVDSDNTAGIFGAPDRTDAEDGIEFEEDEPGKYIPANTFDADQDQVPDYADGFNLDDAIGNEDDVSGGDSFTPLVVEVPNWTTHVEPMITFDFSFSNPSSVGSESSHYPQPSGGLRFWTVDAGTMRNKEEIDSGHLVKPGTAYSLEELGLAPGQSKTFYLEGVGSGLETFTATLDPGTNFNQELMHDDKVTVTIVDVDLDIDTDNSGALLSGPDRNTIEDRFESDQANTGKFIDVNDTDIDEDGIIDLADGFDRDDTSGTDDDQIDGGPGFTPIVLQLSDSVDPSEATLQFVYDAALPSDVRDEETHFEAGSNGNFRIWTKNGNQAREVNGVSSGNRFVAPGVNYTLQDLGVSTGNQVTLYVEGVVESSSLGGDMIQVTLDVDGSGDVPAITQDIVRLTVANVDLDVDSDNTAGWGGAPERGAFEDVIEDHSTKPGKFIWQNLFDADEDGVVDTLDGFNNNGILGDDDDLIDNAGVKFTPLVLEIPSPINAEEARFKLEYNASDPTGDVSLGAIRIWTKDVGQARDGSHVGAGGDFVKPNFAYSLADLGAPNSQTRTVTLYIEGIGLTTGLAERIVVKLDPDGQPDSGNPTEGNVGYELSDAVRVSVVGLDLDVDSDNNNGLALPDRTAFEDSVEFVRLDPSRPGKFVIVNGRDADEDGVTDHIDDLIDSQNGKFTPLVLEVPGGIDLAKARFRVTYSGSDPGELQYDSNGIAQPAAGHLRVWTANGNEARDANAANATQPGDYVAPVGTDGNDGIYSFAELGGDVAASGRIITLYIEGIDISAGGTNLPGQQPILVELDPDGIAPEEEAGGSGSSGSGSSSSSSTYPLDEYQSELTAYNADFGPWDAIFVTVVNEVTLSATDIYAAEDPILNKDDASFVFSRGEGNVSGDLTVWFEVEMNQNGLDPGRTLATLYTDYILYSESTTTFNSTTGIGTIVIPDGQSTAVVDVLPYADDIVEWDEDVKITLLSNPQYDSGVPYTPTPTLPYYVSNIETESIAILDSDEVDGFVNRNVDTESTGLAADVISNSAVDVGVQQGFVNLTLPLVPAGFAPTYVGNDNLHPIVSVEFNMPGGISPDTISAALTFGGIESDSVSFNASPVSGSDRMRIVVLGSDEIVEELRGGHYEYDIELTVTSGGENRVRTLRGSTEIVNRVGEDFGTSELGQRWWIDGLDRIVPGDGISPIRTHDEASLDTSEALKATSRLAPKGAAAENGAALIRGDGTSAWYKATITSSDVVETIDESELSLGSLVGWATGTGQGGHQDSYHISSGGLTGQAESVQWEFTGLSDDRSYQVFTTWVPEGSRASEVPYTVNGREVGTGATNKTILVNQQYAPGELAINGTDWRSLGYFVPSSGSLSVSLSTFLGLAGFVDGEVVADAVMLVGSWKYETPEGSYNQLDHGALNDKDGYFADPGYTPEDGDFTLLTKNGGHYQFDKDGLLQTHQDRNKNQTLYEYTDADSDGLADEIESITDAFELETAYRYSDGFINEMEDFAGRVTTFSGGDQIISVTAPDPVLGGGDQPEFSFAYAGPGAQLSRVTNARGGFVDIDYGGSYRATQVTNADAATWELTPQIADGLSQSDSGAVIHRIVTDQIGNLLTPGAGTSFVEPRAVFTDPRGNDWTYQTDHYGLVTAMADPAPYQNVWRYERREDGLVETMIEPAGGGGIADLGELTTTYQYDTRGNRTNAAYPLSTSETWGYNPSFGVLTNYTDRRGFSTSFGLDGRGNVTSISRPEGVSEAFTYTPSPANPGDLPGGLVSTHTDARGVVTETTYFTSGAQLGLIEKIEHAKSSPGIVEAASTETFTYDARRNPLTHVQIMGADDNRQTDFVYDELNRQIEVSRPSEEYIDQSGVTVTQQPKTTYEYDAQGLLVKQTDPLGRVTEFEYDGEFRPTITKLPEAIHFEGTAIGTFTREYDEVGNLENLIDTLGRTTSYEYDERNWTIKQTLPATDDHGESVTIYDYDTLGNVKSIKDPLHSLSVDREQTFVYDALHRQTRQNLAAPGVHPETGSQPHAAPYLITQYDGGSDLVKSVVDATGRTIVSNDYDDLGRRTDEYQPEGVHNVWQYDAAGNITGTKDSQDNQVTFVYDAQNRVVTITDPATSQHAAPVTQYTYNDAGQQLTVTETTPTGTRVTTNEYDDLGRLIRTQLPPATHTDPETLAAFTEAAEQHFQYDAVGNLRLHTDTADKDQAFVYDARDRQIATISASETSASIDLTQSAAALFAAGHSVTTMVYDNAGQLRRRTQNVGSGNRTTEYEYDNQGRLIVRRDPEIAGGTRRTKYVFDAGGRLKQRNVAATGETTQTTDYVYDNLDRQVQVISPAVNGGRPTTSTLYDIVGRPVESEDALDRLTSTQFDALDRPTQVTLPNLPGKSTAVVGYEYDTLSRTTGVTNPRGFTTNAVSDAYGRTTEILAPATSHANPSTGGSTVSRATFSSVYDILGRNTSQSDPLGRTTTFSYDNLDRHTTTQLPTVGGVPSTWHFGYDIAGNQITSVDPSGSQTVTQFDNQHRRQSVQLPDFGDGVLSDDEVNSFTTAGPDAWTDETGDGLSNDYSSIPIGSGDNTATWTVNDLESASYEVYITWPVVAGASSASPVSIFDGDALEQATTVNQSALPSGDAPENPGDPVWQKLGEFTISSGTLKLQIADNAGGLAIADAIRFVEKPSLIQYQYNEAGEVVLQTDPLGRQVAYEYDAWGRVVRETRPDPDGDGPELSPITLTEYDGLGRTVSTTQVIGAEGGGDDLVTQYEYDSLNRKTKEIDPDGGETLYAYDLAGNLLSLTDSTGNTTSYQYDDWNQVVLETTTVSGTTLTRQYDYDLNGNLIELVDRGGNKFEFDYDPSDRQTVERWYDENGTLTNTITTRYDIADRLYSQVDDFSAYTYQFDALDRMTAVSNFDGSTSTPGVAEVTLASLYDTDNRRVTLAATIDGTADFLNEYVYNGRDQLKRLTQSDQGGTTPVGFKDVRLGYDSAEQLDQVTRYTTDALDESVLVASTSYQYDDASRLIGMTHGQGANLLAQWDWAYDQADRLTSFTSSDDGAAYYTYDSRSQLTGEYYTSASQTSLAYQYDANGNRTGRDEVTLPASFDLTDPGAGTTVTSTDNFDTPAGTHNRTETDGTYDYEYDAMGNRNRRTHIVDGTVTLYDWDVRNRLVSVTEYIDATDADAETNATRTIEYTYDVQNRRIGKTVDDGTTEQRERYVWDITSPDDKGNVVLDFVDDNSDSTADADELDKRYLWGQQVDQLFAQETIERIPGTGGNPNTFDVETDWTLTDHLGTVRDIVNYDEATDTSTVDEHFTYTAFGEVTSGDTTRTRYLYTAQELDTDTGLIYYDARWYDPNTGEFLSQDPIAFEAGDPNLYRYVGNGPTNATDPTGLYDEAGHFYTTYVVSRIAGFSKDESLELAYYSQAGDEDPRLEAYGTIRDELAPTDAKIIGKSVRGFFKGLFSSDPFSAPERAQAESRNDRRNRQYILDVNELYHSLHGGGPDDVAKRRQILGDLISDTTKSLKEIGLLIHSFGDSYAHTYEFPNKMGVRGNEWLSISGEEGERYAYPWPDGHGATKDAGHAPDMIPYDYENHRLYAEDLLRTLVVYRGAKVSEEMKTRLSTFLSSVRQNVTTKRDGGKQARIEMRFTARELPAEMNYTESLFPEEHDEFRIPKFQPPTQDDLIPLMDEIFRQHYGNNAYQRREASRSDGRL
ncbi:Calx-beta domain-containing protein [Neorhodopirellula lusitana]|uniref:Calx-beta domain-containing protein n=1 Tax=Neorhodopirellula lusitana TaxID=445327 RepID=UPI003850295B